MSETDPHYEDDATEIASVMQAFRQINENIETLNENQNDSTRTLSNLVRVEYADELARLRESVEGLVQEQAALAKTVDKKQTAVRDLYDASRSLKGQDTRLSSVTGDLEELGQQLNGIVARPAERAEQRANLRMWAAIGFLSCLLLVFCGLWALPYRAETAMARMIMGDSYWNSAWRMMDMFSMERADGMRVLTWVDAGPEEAEKHKACRNKAWESGEHQECVVVFRPRSGG